MAAYVVSLGVGLVVGVIYGCVGVRSPAPPVIALLGLLGILAGEQSVAAWRAWAQKQTVTIGTAAPPITTEVASRHGAREEKRP